MHTLRRFAAALLFAIPAAAQQKIVESIEVRIVNVDVVVTDRSGQPVTGLTRDDFQIFENGKPQPITNFYEVRPERPTELSASKTNAPTADAAVPEPPEELRVRRFVIFFDNYSLHPFKRNEVLKALGTFVDQRLRPQDEVELVLWTRSLSVITPFTTDRTKIKAGMATLAERSRSGMSVQNEIDMVKRRCQDALDAAKTRRLTWPQAYDVARGEVSAYSDQAWSMTQTLLEALRLTSTTLAGVDGRKILLFAGAHLPEKPGAELYSYIYSLFSPYWSPPPPTEAFARSQSFSIEKLARQANADGVTFYTIDAADFRDFSSAEQAESTDLTEQFLSFTNTAMAYQMLANITGGVALANTQNFDKAFENVARDLGAYYSLGYKPGAEGKGDRRISVKTTNASYTTRARQSYSTKTAEETVNDRVVANLYHSNIKSEWPVSVTVGTPQKNGERFSVPLELKLDPSVTLLPQGDELVGGFNVYIAVGSDNGAMSKVMKSPQPVRIPKNAEAQLRSKPFSFTLTIVVRPGESTLSIAAVDQISNTSGYARARIVAR